ncbi:MAG: D-aminoacylase [Acidobacteria bacterium]|nr:D-aminoacylase [Acidobacteriota bacterium]
MRRTTFLLVLLSPLAAADFDLLIVNGRLVDGMGNPWFRGDLGVRAGRIAAMGNLAGKTADRTLNVDGRIVAPGFIDVHTHIEGDVEKLPAAANFVLDGVTTMVTGNCGGSVTAVAEWFERLTKLDLGANVATLIGHNAVRRAVMGDANRDATPEELDRMRALIDQAMRDGAAGFSTGLIYIPGTYSNTAEVVSLAAAAARHGGVYASHMRDEGEHVLQAIEEAVRVGRENAMRVQLSHFKIDNRKLWGASEKSLALVEKHRAEGVDVVVDQYPYDRSSTNLGITLPSWALADGQEKILQRLNDPLAKAKIKDDMASMLDQKGLKDYSYAIVASFPPDRSYDGKTISEINRLKGRESTVSAEIETILEMMAAGRAQMVYHSMGQDDVDRIMRYPWTAVASDGGIQEMGVGVPHPRSYGTNARVLARAVRERKLLTLEDAIRRMTSLPARTFGLRDRGVLLEGAAADLVIFDPEKVEDKATFAEPHQYSAGFQWVIVNGVITAEESRLTGGRGGKVLRHAVE